LGVCGEHGGDPQSIDFFERVGLDYVSCSPYRVPIARLAAARAYMAHGAPPESAVKTQPVAAVAPGAAG
jgi:pyruvate,orthophosphate dikinase